MVVAGHSLVSLLGPSCCRAIRNFVLRRFLQAGEIIACACHPLLVWHRGRREPTPESAQHPLGRPAMLPGGLSHARGLL